jgi:hypothetical protein
MSRANALAMVFKLAKSAERTWRKLDSSEQLGKLIRGIKFRDGEPIQDDEAYAAA